MEIFTIGFTQTTAEDFFGRLKQHRIERLLDVRLSNSSQLAGFAKRDDLAYFLRELLGADYEHAPLLAPTQEIFDEYKKRKSFRGAHCAALQRGDPRALSSQARRRVPVRTLARSQRGSPITEAR